MPPRYWLYIFLTVILVTGIILAVIFGVKGTSSSSRTTAQPSSKDPSERPAPPVGPKALVDLPKAPLGPIGPIEPPGPIGPIEPTEPRAPSGPIITTTDTRHWCAVRTGLDMTPLGLATSGDYIYVGDPGAGLVVVLTNGSGGDGKPIARHDFSQLGPKWQKAGYAIAAHPTTPEVVAVVAPDFMRSSNEGSRGCVYLLKGDPYEPLIERLEVEGTVLKQGRIAAVYNHVLYVAVRSSEQDRCVISYDINTLQRIARFIDPSIDTDSLFGYEFCVSSDMTVSVVDPHSQLLYTFDKSGLILDRCDLSLYLSVKDDYHVSMWCDSTDSATNIVWPDNQVLLTINGDSVSKRSVPPRSIGFNNRDMTLIYQPELYKLQGLDILPNNLGSLGSSVELVANGFVTLTHDGLVFLTLSEK